MTDVSIVTDANGKFLGVFDTFENAVASVRLTFSKSGGVTPAGNDAKGSSFRGTGVNGEEILRVDQVRVETRPDHL